ncbi:hypothetical protein JTE90_025044 [Oedothorax gibbosus]|uniref:Uncharacterized protein n=1 Tax=Oedothorax gibbosus TaxID=931172 RepID=A0AAV6TSR6_9ARAC|nr:hypothetical protein JTE90_025044 [Oedothorax gibbosus]
MILSVLEYKSKDYDIVLQDDFINLTKIPRKSVYVAAGLAVKVKKYQKRYYISFSKGGLDTERKKFINVPIAEIGNVQKALTILDKHIKKYA